MKVLVKEGWVNQDTGKKSEPRIQFTLVQYLQDVLDFAKKLIVLLVWIPILSISWGIFFRNKGDNLVTFEIMELEKVKIRKLRQLLLKVDDFVDENDAMEVSESAETETAASVVEVEEIKVVTKLTMASRKLKIKNSNELLMELEKMQVNFKLN
jgi:DNA polymerase-3 subunit alpha